MCSAHMAAWLAHRFNCKRVAASSSRIHVKTFSPLIGLNGRGASWSSRILKIERQMVMRRPPKIVIWLCLLALVFCQTAAAVSACGPGASLAGPDAAQTAAALPCHGVERHQARCDASDCVVGQALQDVSGSAFAALPIAPGRLEWDLTRTEARIAPMSARARAPSYPPPHFLGRLLI